MTNNLAAAQEQMPHRGATDEQRAAAIRHVLRRIDVAGDTPAQAHEALQILGLIPDVLAQEVRP